MKEEAAKRPTVVYIDAYSLFSVKGEYASSFPDDKGNQHQMRIGDGVHFTVAGAEYLAQHVFTLLDSRWNLTGQAEPDTPINYTIEPEGGSVGGVNLGNGNGNGSGNGNGNGSSASTTTAPSATTTAGTSAPTTTAPTATTKPPHSTTTTPTATTTP
jgi:hypothetical protein